MKTIEVKEHTSGTNFINIPKQVSKFHKIKKGDILLPILNGNKKVIKLMKVDLEDDINR